MFDDLNDIEAAIIKCRKMNRKLIEAQEALQLAETDLINAKHELSAAKQNFRNKIEEEIIRNLDKPKY